MGGWENELKVMMEINTAPLYPHNIPSTDYPTDAKIKNIHLSISIIYGWNIPFLEEGEGDIKKGPFS